LALFLACPGGPALGAIETWEQLDKRLKGQIFQLNVGIKIKVKGDYAHLTDLSPRYKFAVFGTTPDDKGFRVVGFGSSFPIRTGKGDKTYFLTNRHVVDSGEGIIQECQRFFAAMRLNAQQTAGFTSAEQRYKDLLTIVNMSQKKEMNFAERAIYNSTVDGIWDTYENSLSTKADPQRSQFHKYLAMAGVESETGYFLHAPGPVSQPAVQAQLYKVARTDAEPDLAILAVNNPGMTKLDLDIVAPSEGQEIQVIGYPLASDQIDADSAKYYAPTFTTGRVSRVAPRLLHVDAPVTVGNSGGPVVSLRGKVLGVVVRRAMIPHTMNGQVVQAELPNFGGAITVQSVKTFAPELFSNITIQQ
jgi:S1-C subfamily serine protease